MNLRFKHILLLTALLAVHVACTETEQGEILAQISTGDKFGQALSAMVQMHSLSPDGRVEEIRELLEEIKAQIEATSERETTKHQQREAECESDIASLEQSVATLKGQYSEGETEFDDLTKELSDKSSQVDDLRTQLNTEQSDLKEYQSQVQDAEDTYAENKASFEDAIRSCEEAVRLLTELARTRSSSTTSFAQNGVMFVQLSQKFEAVKTVLEAGKHSTFVQPIIDVLMQLSQSSHIDTNQVQQIIELINTLLNRLRNGLRERYAQHQHTVEGLNNLIADLTAQVRQHSQQLEIYEDRITAINERRSTLQNVIDQSDTILQATLALLDGARTDCESDSNAYTSAENSRESQIATLERLINYFESQVATTTSNIRD